MLCGNNAFMRLSAMLHFRMPPNVPPKTAAWTVAVALSRGPNACMVREGCAVFADSPTNRSSLWARFPKCDKERIEGVKRMPPLFIRVKRQTWSVPKFHLCSSHRVDRDVQIALNVRRRLRIERVEQRTAQLMSRAIFDWGNGVLPVPRVLSLQGSDVIVCTEAQPFVLSR